MKKPDIKKNPHPRMRYEITIKIEGAPGAFDSVTGFVQYRVANERCVPLQPVSGATVPPEDNIPLALTRVSDDEYRGTVYSDLLQDEDYYGLGVCHWSMVAVVTELKKGAVRFSPDLSSDELARQGSKTTYFWKGDYLDAGTERSEIGNTQRSYFKQEIQRELFTVTLTSKEAFQ
ncbi:hypothetical protein ACPPVV_03660 [Rhodanobacter sp. Col0626]|uniref:hypothetical protein n=1 Tax=Rhodanobacter sp. Col0626 TaxID=3415679 RepID=UPI003CF83485